MRYIRFTNDGWYARYDEGLNERSIMRIADAAAAYWADKRPGATVYVGYDTRRDARDHAQKAAMVLGSWGLKVRLSDIYCPMPALNHATRHDPEAIGALMITGDHRNANYSGIRVRNADSSAITSDVADVIESLVPLEHSEAAGPFEFVDFITPFMHAVAEVVDVDSIREARLRCIVDPMYGTARGFAAQLFRVLGVDAVEIHGEPREDFGGLHPEVVEPWVDDCEFAVVETGADLGIAIDGPSNRAIAVDEEGRLVPAPKLHALILEHLVQTRGLEGRVVAPRHTSAILRRQAERLGCALTPVAQGPSWAFEEALQGDVLTMGDGLGGICIPVIDPERNAFVTALLLLEIMAKKKLPLSQLVRDLDGKLGPMEYGHRDLRMDAGRYQVLRNLMPGLNAQGQFAENPVAVSHADGVRLQFQDDSWVLMRPSETEPLVRIYAEGPTKASRDALIEGAVDLLDKAVESLL